MPQNAEVAQGCCCCEQPNSGFEVTSWFKQSIKFRVKQSEARGLWMVHWLKLVALKSWINFRCFNLGERVVATKFWAPLFVGAEIA